MPLGSVIWQIALMYCDTIEINQLCIADFARAVVQSARTLSDIAAACRQLCDTLGGYTNILPDTLSDAILSHTIAQQPTADTSLPDWVTDCTTITHMYDIDTNWADQVGETTTCETVYRDSAMWIECEMMWDEVAPEQALPIVIGVILIPTPMAPINVGIRHTPVARKPMPARSTCKGLWRSRVRAWG